MNLKPGKTPHKVGKRQGGVTKPEKDLVAAFVQDQPREITESQVNGLARTLRRSKDVTKRLIEDARERFVDSAGRYVDIHMQAAEAALVNGDAKSLEVASKAAQWALTNIGAEGTRIVDKPSAETNTPKVLIGIKIGGVNSSAPVITVDPE